MMFLLQMCSMFSSTSGYKIFMYSTPLGFSHVQLMESVATTLQNSGHKVVVAHPVLEEKFRDHWEKSPAKKIYATPPEDIKEKHRTRTENIWIAPPFGGNLKTGLRLISIQQDLCDAFLNETAIIDQLKEENFDIGIFEFFGGCGLGLGEIIGVKSHIMMSAIGVVDSMAPIFHNPYMASYVPASMTLYTDQMSFFQRFVNFAWVTLGDIMYDYLVTKRYEQIWASHGHNIITYDVLKRKTNFILANSDEFLDLQRPLSRKVKFIGGLALGQIGKLNEHFHNLLSYREKGSVLISFGSVAPTSSMPKHIKEGILETVKQFPEYTFIWKTDKSDVELANGISNLETTTWLPQRELLNDSRLKLFVTHAGLNSILETARTGTPAILVPIFNDQFKNSAHMSRKNTSIVLEKDNFTGDKFADAVGNILKDHSYTVRAKRLADLMTTKTETPVDRLLEAVEFSGKFGKIHDLDIYGFELGFIQYFCLDVIVAWICLFAIIVYFVYKLVKLVCCRNKVKLD